MLGATIKDLTGYDAATKQGGLQGDATALAVIGQLRRALTIPITGLGGGVSTLAQAGITVQKDGTLRARQRQAANRARRRRHRRGGAVRRRRQVERVADPLQRAPPTHRQPAPTRSPSASRPAAGSLNGTGTAALADGVTPGSFDAAFVIDADNDTFSLKVDGVQAGTVTLSQGSYATAAALVAEIQSKINGDATLKGCGRQRRGVVRYRRRPARRSPPTAAARPRPSRSPRSTPRSRWPRSASSATSGTAGVDVAGTINGIAADRFGPDPGRRRRDRTADGLTPRGARRQQRHPRASRAATPGKLDKLVDRLLARQRLDRQPHRQASTVRSPTSPSAQRVGQSPPRADRAAPARPVRGARRPDRPAARQQRVAGAASSPPCRAMSRTQG
ncbi:MAG: hypothetical protein MZV65_52075 [Chromatiales bacterium]|nr:hypothetical protein [Chromatiales bacterium]